MKLQKLYHGSGVAMLGCFLLMQTPTVLAANTGTSALSSASKIHVLSTDNAITDLKFSSLPGDKVQIALSFEGAVNSPTVFKTDNPARIALDFSGVQSNLQKKMYPVNKGAAKAVYVAEAADKTRVVVNLVEAVSHEVKTVDDKVFITLRPTAQAVASSVNKIKVMPRKLTNKALNVASLLPKQTIKDIDFRRGGKGEGRILVNLSSENTMVDVTEQGGKVVLNFLNTKLPESLIKSFDVSDFATPVQRIDAQPYGSGVSLTITTANDNFDYSSYQSNGILAVDFYPLSKAEKQAKLKEKFPYSGKKLTFNFQDIEVRSVLQILADFTGLNIVASDSVQGNVSLRLNDVPWDQALDLILKSKGLAKRKMGNVVLVAPAIEITKIEKEELAAQKVVEQLEPLRTEYIQINFAKAEDIQTIITGSDVVKSMTQQTQTRSRMGPGDSSGGGSGSSDIFSGNNSTSGRSSRSSRNETQGVLSERGSSTVDGRTNTIIVKDTARQLKEIRAMVRILDVPVRQVMIEARIVTADTDFRQEIGVKFGIAKAAEIGSGKVFAMGAGSTTYGELVPDSNGSNVSVPDGAGYLVDLGANAINGHPVGALGMTLARAADYVLNLELSALENDNRGEIIANPRVMTSDRELAFIKQGVQIPYETISQEGTQTELVDAVLELNVTPQITPEGDVIMELLIKKDNPKVNTRNIQKREIETRVRVKDGETIVLGGVYESEAGKNAFKVPFFGDLPGIGFLFKKNVESDSKRELLIFVTPKIIKDSLSAR